MIDRVLQIEKEMSSSSGGETNKRARVHNREREKIIIHVSIIE